MVSAIGIVPIALDLLWRDGNVLPVLSAPRVDVATDVLDFGRVAIRIITTATVGIIRHVPCRIKLLVQSLILGGMGDAVLLRSRLQGRDSPPGMLVSCTSSSLMSVKAREAPLKRSRGAGSSYGRSA